MLDTTRFEVHVTPCFYSIDPVPSSDAAAAGAAGTADPPAPRPEETVWVNVPCPYTRELVVHAIARSV